MNLDDMGIPAKSPPKEYSTVRSASGIHDHNSFGVDLYKQICPQEGEAHERWFARLQARIPEVTVGEVLTDALLKQIVARTEYELPKELMSLWAVAPGISIEHHNFLFTPADFLRENMFYVDFVPEIPKQMVFVGGNDGFNAAVALGADDTFVYEWSHEEGFTGLKAASIMHYVSEAIAWYATTFSPFCVRRGYVPK
ncbi:MAG: hypothetical protein IPK32_21050 [Verrucomicrobiaceae bacterium]|nr:hypothetical protein [Verrucomicrobiaceae bacterium]